MTKPSGIEVVYKNDIQKHGFVIDGIRCKEHARW
jgi:hypothetical protein